VQKLLAKAGLPSLCCNGRPQGLEDVQGAETWEDEGLEDAVKEWL